MNETQCLRSLYWIRMGQGLLLLVLLASCQGCGGESPKTGGSVATGMTATLTWAAPTTNVDGTELTGLARYTIYYGQSSHHYTETITLPITSTLCQRKGDVEVCSYTISGLGEGVYYFAVTASNAANKESGYSNEVSKKMD